MKNEGKSFELCFIRILSSLKAICPQTHLCPKPNSQRSTFSSIFLAIRILQLACDPLNYPRNRNFPSKHLSGLFHKRKGTFYWGSMSSQGWCQVRPLTGQWSFADWDDQEEILRFAPNCQYFRLRRPLSWFWWKIFEHGSVSELHYEFLWAPKSSSSLFHRAAILDRKTRYPE